MGGNQPAAKRSLYKGDYSEQWFTRLDLLAGRNMEVNLKELPTQCDIGAKRNSRGHLERLRRRIRSLERLRRHIRN